MLRVVCVGGARLLLLVYLRFARVIVAGVAWPLDASSISDIRTRTHKFDGHVWTLGSEEDCCTKLVANTDESIKMLGAVNTALSSSSRILNLRHIIAGKFMETSGQSFLAALHWRDDEDFVRSSHGLDLEALDKAMCMALIDATNRSTIHSTPPLHVLLLGDILPRKLEKIRGRVAHACPTVEARVKLHTKTTIMPLDSQISSSDLGGDDIKGQVSGIELRFFGYIAERQQEGSGVVDRH